MNSDLHHSTHTLRSALLRLARVEDDRAAAEAAAVPYWQPCPPSVEGHHLAAAAMRDAADALLGIGRAELVS